MQTIEILMLLATVIVGSSSLQQRRLNWAQPARPRRGFRRHTALSISGVAVGLVVAASVAHAQHTVRLPQPTGPYAIGTTRFALVDATRPETFTDDPADRRALYIRVWYPAQPASAGARPEAFWGKETPEIAARLAEAFRLPKGAFDDLARVESHAYTDAAIAKSRTSFPTLVFSHGFAQGVAAQNTAQMEELASHGYVIFSIGHPYETLINVYPDGRVVTLNQAHTAQFMQEQGKSGPLYAKLVAAGELTAKEAIFRELVKQSPLLTESLNIWTKDTQFLLDEIEKMNAGKSAGLFTGQLDLKRLGVFGMSFGGTTAGQVCVVDARCKAGINIDGTQFGDMLDRPIDKPFMFMHSDNGRGINHLFYERARRAAYLVTVKGASHLNYSDLSLFSPDYKKAGLLGPIDGPRMVRITSAYVLAFFDKYLKGKDAPLLKGPAADYPEVEFNAHGRR